MDAECGFHTEPNGSDLLGLHGPTILVDIGFDPAFQPGNDAVPVAAITNMSALIDTGASQTFIDTGVATALGLPIVDKETACMTKAPPLKKGGAFSLFKPGVARVAYRLEHDRLGIC